MCKCKGAHHTFLHREHKTPQKSYYEKQKPLTKTTSHVISNSDILPKTSNNNEQQNILLATALVYAKTFNGEKVYLRILIDQGSQASFITENAAQMLGNPHQRISAEITGVRAGEPKISKSKISVQLSSRFPSQFSLTKNFY